MRMSPPAHQNHHQQSRRFRLDSEDADAEESSPGVMERQVSIGPMLTDENENLRSQITRLASELESIKSLITLGSSGSNANNNNGNSRSIISSGGGNSYRH